MARDVEALILVNAGSLRDSTLKPAGVEVQDASGLAIVAIDDFLHHMIGRGDTRSSCRAYASQLLRWWRFLATINVDWERATREDFIDHVVWMRCVTPKRGSRVNGRRGYKPRTINLACAAISEFYSFHVRRGRGPLVNPARDDERRRPGRLKAATSDDDERRMPGRQKVPRESPKSIPDEVMARVFAGLRHDRDRALVEFYLSSGARATEILNITAANLDFGNHRIEVERKGQDDRQWVPASPEAFIWLRRYLGTRHLAPSDPVWLTLRAPRPLGYDAVRQVFLRAQKLLGTGYTLHQLRHTAGYRMAQDPQVPLLHVQWIFGHASLQTTELYVRARPEEVFARAAEHYRRRSNPKPQLTAEGYSEQSMQTLLGHWELES